MTIDPRLERYLTSLERVLQPFPVSDRAEIVTEIKSHVLSALERDPQASLDATLAALGEPETVANRYLLERGLKPTKPPISPIVKWIVIGILATIAMILAFSAFLFLHFSPFVNINKKGDQVSLLGGLVQVNAKENEVLIRGISAGSSNQVAGSIQLTAGQDAHVKLGNGKLTFKTADTQNFAWQCKGLGRDRPQATIEGNIATLDLSGALGTTCEIYIPENAKLTLEGENGKIEFDEPRFDIDATLKSGKVSFAPAGDALYKYDTEVLHGRADAFQSSTAAAAHSVKIHLTNGSLSFEN